MKLQQCFELFITSREILGLSSKSISCYREFNKPFIEFVGSDYIITKLTYNIINLYFVGLLDKPISVSTRATYTRHVKVFLKWIEKEFSIDLGTSHISIPRTPKKNVYIFSNDEIKDIYKSLTCSTYWVLLRNYLIISLMLDSGLRQNEVCSIRPKDINLEKRLLTVRGKGNKERIVSLGNMTSQFIVRYRKECPYKFNNQFMFASNGDSLTGNAIKIMIHRLNHSLPFEVSSHKLRHNFATNYCLDQYEKFGQVDLFQLQVLMGHEDIKTTQRYLHIANQVIASKNTISHIDDIFFLKT